jgi:hypothetical protein
VAFRPVDDRAEGDPAATFAPGRCSQTVNFLVAHEVEVARWEPLGVIDVDDREQVGIAIARLDWHALPGVFRLIELEGSDWVELELAADGVVVEP